MDGLSRAIGAGAPVSLAGVVYFLAPMTLEIIGVVENHLLLKRETPAESIREALRAAKDKRLRDQLLENASREFAADPMRRIATHQQFQDFIDTDDGIKLTAWLCLRETERETFARFAAVDAAWKQSSEEEKVEFVRTRNHISGISLLCLLDWPQEESQVPAAALERRRRRRGDGYVRANWRLNFNRIAKGFTGVSFDDIRHMTLYEYRMMCVDEKDLHLREVAEVTPDEAGKIVRQKRVMIGKGGPSPAELIEMGVATPLSDDEQALMAAAAARYRAEKSGGDS